MSNIVNAYLEGSTCGTAPLYQYDYGQILKISGVELPDTYEVHFSNTLIGNAIVAIGNADGVQIPDIYLRSGAPVYAWIYLHTGEDDGETKYLITIPVIGRAAITGDTPTPVQQDAITQAIAALNAAVGNAEEAITHYPIIRNGYWYVWDATSGEYVNTNVAAQGPKGDPIDVQVNGASILDAQGVANVPMASTTAAGVVKYSNSNGVVLGSGGLLSLNKGTDATIKAGESIELAVRIAKQHLAAFYGLAKAAGSDEKNSTLPVGQYTDAAKSAIHEMLNGSVSVSGTTPVINALPGMRYVCGEVATLDITLPASGIVDVVFESGSTATVLTITPPTGQTVKWANGFDPTSLDANTTYEINIADGLGVAGAWA